MRLPKRRPRPGWIAKFHATVRTGWGFGPSLRETGRMIGQCGLTWQEADGRTVLEVGYLFSQAYWHRGYATEAARACRDFAFDTLGAKTVYSIIRDTNAASRAVALRNGMHRVGGFVKHYRGVEMPHDVFAVSAPER